MRKLIFGALLLTLAFRPGSVVILHAAAALVEQNVVLDSSNDTTGEITLANLSAGNLVVVSMCWTARTQTVTGVADGTNTYTLVYRWAHLSESANCEIWHAPNVAAAGGTVTITVTISGNSTTKSINASEWSGMATASVVDQSNGASEDGVVSPWLFTGPSITTTNANNLLYAVVAADTNQTSPPFDGTPGNSFTLLSGTGLNRVRASYRIVSSTGTYNTTFTGEVNGDSVQIITSFKEAAGGGGGVTCGARALLGVGC